MIIDSIRFDTNAKKRVQNRLPDLKQYSVVGFRPNGDFSILRNRDIYVSKIGNTDFPPLVGEFTEQTF